MIGVVIASHSEKAAEGIRDIAEQMGSEGVVIKAAGGTEDGRIGSSPIRIKEAIEEIKYCDYILIFADLGSSVMGSEMAREMLEDCIAQKIRIVDAPLVEGVIAAVIQASITDDIEEVIQTAIESKNISKF